MSLPLTSISNIAWPHDADDAALELAYTLGFTGIEIAPVKVFGPLAEVPEASVKAYRDRLAAMGLKIPAMQGLFFGLADLSIFGALEAQDRMRTALRDVARVAGAVGAGACVFGAPKLRDPGDLPAGQAFDQAVAFFRDVACVFADHGTVLAFEANAPAWGCRFITTTAEALSLVRAVDHPAFRLQLDGGTVFAMGEPEQVVAEAIPFSVHVHVSEPELAVIGSRGSDHAMIASLLHRHGYAGWRSVEMRQSEDWRGAMVQAAEVMRRLYG